VAVPTGVDGAAGTGVTVGAGVADGVAGFVGSLPPSPDTACSSPFCASTAVPHFSGAATLSFYNLFADGRHVSTLANIGQSLSFPIRFQAPRGEQQECRRNEIEAGSGYYGVTQRLGPEAHMHGVRQRSDQWSAKANPKKIVYE